MFRVKRREGYVPRPKDFAMVPMPQRGKDYRFDPIHFRFLNLAIHWQNFAIAPSHKSGRHAIPRDFYTSAALRQTSAQGLQIVFRSNPTPNELERFP
jgi:hypothetical protein